MKATEPVSPFSDPAEAWESKLVWDYFGKKTAGVFVECGANHPVHFSQTYFLEQQGWQGVLIELNPDLCELLRPHRPHSQVYQCAVDRPGQPETVVVRLAKAHGHTSLRPASLSHLSKTELTACRRTLDDILSESGIAEIDFICIDVEGLELDALLGLSLEKWHPKLIFMEDEFENYSKHRHLVARGYKLVRRTSYNNWYVPKEAPVSAFSLSTTRQLIRLYRKMWLGPIKAVWKNFKWVQNL